MPVGGLIAGGLGLAGSVGSALIGSNAASNASAQQVQLGQQSLAQQNALFQQGVGLTQPFINAGQAGISQLQGALSGAPGTTLGTLQSLLTPGPNQTATLSQLPGFQFAQDWGQKAVANLGSTLGFGGNTLKAGADYATGAAQQGFSGLVGNLLSLFGSQTGALQNLVGTGANAASSAFGNATQTGANIGGTLTGIGNAQASGILGSANALSGGLTGGANSVSNALLFSKLLGGGAGGGSGASAGGGGIYSGDNAAFSPTNTSFAYGGG